MTEEDLSGKSLLVRNVMVGWLSQLFVIVTGFFLPRVIDQQLGQITVGIWDIAWSLVAYLNLTQLGIASSLNRFVANYRSEGDTEKLSIAVSTVACIQVALTLIILTLVVLIFNMMPVLLGNELKENTSIAQYTFLFLGFSIASQFLFDTSRGVLTGSHRWDIYNGLYSGTQVVCSLTMIGAVLLGYGLMTISIIYFVAITAEGITRTFIARRYCPDAVYLRQNVKKKFAAEIITFGIKAFTMNIAPLIVLQSVNLMIASTLGPAALATFNRPNALVRFVQSFVTRFTFILTPMAGPILIEEGDEGLRKFTIECAKFGMIFTLPIMSIFCLYGDEVVRFWMGDHYVNTHIVVILGAGFILPFAQSPLTRVLVGLNYHGRAAVISVVTSSLIMLVGIPVIFWAGPSLEAFALLVTATFTLAYGILIPVYACRKLNLGVRSYIRQAFLPAIYVCTPVFLATWAADIFMGFEGFEVLANVMVYLAVVALGYWNWLLTDEQKQVVRKTLRFE